MSIIKLKNIFIVVLSLIILITSSFLGFVFAIQLDTGYENIESGMYYIKGYDNGLYIGDLDYYSVILGQYIGNSQQRWEFIYVSDGYYNIRNAGNGRYLTAPSDNLEGSIIQQTYLSSSYTDRQLWSIVPAYYGAESYYIQAKSQESNELFLAGSDTLGSYGYDLIQRGYGSYYDIEWTLKKVSEATLIGISYINGGHNHTTPIYQANNDYMYAGYVTSMLTPTSMTVATVKYYLQNSNVFILHSHGDWNVSGSYIYLNESGTNVLHANDIYNYNTASRIDMSDCKVAIFAGCYTSYNSSYNLPLASIHAGAYSSVGFDSNVECEVIGEWIKRFSYAHASQYNPAFAAETAAEYTGLMQTIDIYYQIG